LQKRKSFIFARPLIGSEKRRGKTTQATRASSKDSNPKLPRQSRAPWLAYNRIMAEQEDDPQNQIEACMQRGEIWHLLERGCSRAAHLQQQPRTHQMQRRCGGASPVEQRRSGGNKVGEAKWGRRSKSGVGEAVNREWVRLTCGSSRVGAR
jgi:hypothetical protein